MQRLLDNNIWVNIFNIFVAFCKQIRCVPVVPEFLGISMNFMFEIYLSNITLKVTCACWIFSDKMALAPNMRLLSSLCKNACKVSSARFSVSSPVAGNVSVVTDDKGIATVSMDKSPVNSLNTELIQACAHL